jgi:pimeloyl-ACP methyl ester carboxylesterase
VTRSALVAPFGGTDPPQDSWAQRPAVLAGLLTADPETRNAPKAAPEGADSVEWPIEQTGAAEAAARPFWPLGDTRLARRLPLIDLPLSCARRFAERLGGPAETRAIPGAAHPAELDRPDEVARAVLDWLN